MINQDERKASDRKQSSASAFNGIPLYKSTETCLQIQSVAETVISEQQSLVDHLHQFASPQTNGMLLTLLRERAPALILGLGQYFSVSVSLPWTMMEVFDAHAATSSAMACLVAA
jgi:hypothetical protein